MTIPDYFQELNDFSNPNGHPNQADFMAEGLTTIEATTGNLIWNAAGRAVMQEMISTRFSLAVGLYNFIRYIEPGSADPDIARQVVARGYHAIPSTSSGQGLMLAVPSA